MLSQLEAVRYLLRRGLIDTAHVVRDTVTVANVSRRHLNFRVSTQKGPSYLLKQGVGKERAAAVRHEAAMYRRLSSMSGFPDKYTPHLHVYDDVNDVLIFEWVTGAENLRDYHLRRGYFPVLLARAMADAMSRIHRSEVGKRREAPGSSHIPWVLSVHRPTLQFFQDCSGGSLALIETIQEFSDFCDEIDALREEWREDALIHGDLKWDNCIVSGKAPSARMTRLRIVDWELARTGDPCWDIGSVFHDYLSFWLLSIPITGSQPPERFLDLARFPLEKMHPALRAFWETYARKMGLGAVEVKVWLIRSVRYAAARLIQTAFEQMQGSTQLNGNTICLLQLSQNILKRPHEAAVHLLGIAPTPLVA
ncbi:MAG: phosphotransferase [Kiloniellales bacterium]|nr:phosphotransferase [Kiloniellales bacterium]